MSDAEPQEQPVRDFVDRALRDLLPQPANLRGFLAEVVPDLVDDFDFAKMQPLTASISRATGALWATLLPCRPLVTMSERRMP